MGAASVLLPKGGRVLPISPSICFTDLAATVPAAIGDQVASINGNGAYFQWETQRPSLNGSGGVYWLEFPVDAYLFSPTPGVSASSDHARGAILSSSNTSVWPRFWRTTNTASGTNNSSISAIGYNQGKPFIFNRDDAGGNVVEAVHPTQIGSGIVGVSAIRRGNQTILRVNGVQSTVTTSALNGGYYPNRAVIGSPDAACRIYAVWDCPVGLTDAEVLEIEMDLGTLAGAPWASTPSVTGTLAITEQPDTVAIAGTVGSVGVTGTLAITEQPDTVAIAGTVGAPGTITLGPLMDPQGNLRANESGATLLLYSPTTHSLIAAITGCTTNSSAVMTVTNAAMSPGLQYRTRVRFADGTDDLPLDIAT